MLHKHNCTHEEMIFDDLLKECGTLDGYTICEKEPNSYVGLMKAIYILILMSIRLILRKENHILLKVWMYEVHKATIPYNTIVHSVIRIFYMM